MLMSVESIKVPLVGILIRRCAEKVFPKGSMIKLHRLIIVRWNEDDRTQQSKQGAGLWNIDA